MALESRPSKRARRAGAVHPVQKIRVSAWAYEVEGNWFGTQQEFDLAVLSLRKGACRRIADPRILKRAKKGTEPRHSTCQLTIESLVDLTSTLPDMQYTPFGFRQKLWPLVTRPNLSLEWITSRLEEEMCNHGLERCSFNEADIWLRTSPTNANGSGLEHGAIRSVVLQAWRRNRLRDIPRDIENPYQRIYFVGLLYREAVICQDVYLVRAIREDWQAEVEKLAERLTWRGRHLVREGVEAFLNAYFNTQCDAPMTGEGWRKVAPFQRGVLMTVDEVFAKRNGDELPGTDFTLWPFDAECDSRMAALLPVPFLFPEWFDSHQPSES